MIEAFHLTCVRGSRRLFHALSFSLQPGELLHVQGPNGSGKTSLFRILAGLSMPHAGKVLWQGRPISDQREEYAVGMIYLGHQPAVKDALGVLENLQVTCRLSGMVATHDSLLLALESVGLSACAGLPARVLSQGQRRRLALARLWISRQSLWLLDEPYTALDARASRLLEQRIEQHRESGGMVILTSHQMPDLSMRVLELGA